MSQELQEMDLRDDTSDHGSVIGGHMVQRTANSNAGRPPLSRSEPITCPHVYAYQTENPETLGGSLTHAN